MTRQRVYELALEAKKALAVLVIVEGYAVQQGLLNASQDGVVAGVLGVATAGVTYFVSNEKAPTVPGGKHEARRRA